MNIREKNFISRLQQNNCFNKNELSIILKSFLTLTLKAPTLQDGQTHSNNLSANCQQIV